MATIVRELDPEAVDRLRQGFGGRLLSPGEPEYEQRRRIWNRMIDRRPALIALVRDADDVRRALAFARDHELPISVRGGGHNVSGSALVDGGVVIDHGLRHGVRLDAAAGRVEVEPGTLLGELDAATVPQGVAVPSGINTTTGLAGLTLGGGLGWLMRRHGLTCDHLVAADLVTADGRLVAVDADQEPDLLWGLRGGGGNFGIVTRFVYDLVPMRPDVFAGVVLFDMQEGEAVLRRARDWAEELSQDVTVIAALRTVLPLPSMPPELHGRRVIGIVLCSIAPPETDDDLRATVRSFGTPLADFLGRKPFTAHQAMFDPSVPAGNGYYWKSHFLSALTDAAIDVAIDEHRRAPQPWSYSLIPLLRGAIAEVPEDATAYPFRSPPWLININGVTDRPEEDDSVIAWARACFEAMAPFSTGGVYVNFVGNEGEDRVRAAYGPAYERLARLKARWDPGNVLNGNQNIRPAAARA